MLTNASFIAAATVGSSNDSCAITWHQWHAEYPIESRMGLPSRRARASASSPHGCQSTGLSACCSRYGLVSPARRFGIRRPHASAGFVERDPLEVHAALDEPREPETAF